MIIDTLTNVNGLINNGNQIGNNEKLGNWVAGGDRAGAGLEWTVEMTSSDSESWDVRHRSGQTESLDSSRTQLTIIKIG